MWKDALAAADATFDFHAYDRDRNNVLSNDELIVAVIRPQNDPYGTARGTSLAVDGNPTPLSVAITDLYLSRDEAKFLVGVGLAAHELSHQVIGAEDLYGVCAAVSPGLFSVMANHTRATHLDPFHKLKNGFVSPQAIDLNIQQTTTIALGAVEAQRQILLLRDPSRAGKEMFLIENRFPGTPTFRNYDSPLPGAIVVWQIFEDTSLVTNAAVCPADVRYVRMRAVLSQPGQGFDLAWADGSPAGFRVIAASPGAAVAQVTLQKQ
jgi:M6 family metalloprotease-like protein